MKATEYLPPGRGGVAGCARDADDARLLLEHLNLLPAVPAAPDQAETPS